MFLGVSSLSYDLDYQRFNNWLSEGKHAGLAFLERHAEIRRNPHMLLEGAKSVIVFAFNYFLEDSDSTSNFPKIAKYARFKDYHKHMKRKAEAVLLQLGNLYSEGGQSISGRIVIDSAPILERAIAAKTSRGFIGKNSLYIHPERGSFLLLGEILVDIDLKEDEKHPVNPLVRSKDGGCGSCRRCQVYCPTGALSTDYSVDARLCLAYWTIEHRGLVPESFWPHFKNHFFGCDICQNVCPYNRQSEPSNSSLRHVGFENLILSDVALMSQEEYEKWFGGTPLTRAKIGGLRRNALIAMAVSNDPKLEEVLRKCLENPSELEVISDTCKQIQMWKKNRHHGAGGGT